jgi:CHASE1-domain containing sensor protein
MKRRKVLRAAFFYMVMCWLLLQITDVVAPILDLPAWVAKLIFLLLLCGLPITLILAWEFDLTSLGIYREKSLVESGDGVNTENGNMPANRAVCLMAGIWIVIIGSGLSVGAAAVIHLHEARIIERQFDRVAQEIAHELGHHLNSDSQGLRTLGALFIENQLPGLEIFQHLAEIVIAEHDEIRAIEWVPPVPDVEREAFVARMREIYPGFDIKAFDDERQEIPAQRRDMYFPVTYTVPKIGNEDAIGFDLLSNLDRAAALRDAIRSGAVRQTRPVELVQTNAAGFLMFNPVFMDDEIPDSRAGRTANLRGFMLAVIGVRELVVNALAATPGAGEFLGQFSLYEANENSDAPVFRIDNGGGSELSGSTVASAYVDTGFGQRYRVELRPTRALMIGKFSNEHYIVGGIGILLSFICAMVLNAISRAGEMPDQRHQAADARNKSIGEATPWSAPDRDRLPGENIASEDRKWLPSKWGTN